MGDGQNDPASKTAQVVRADNFVSFYTNAARLAVSFPDIRLYFYETQPEQPATMTAGAIHTTGIQTWLERAVVIFTPEYLKILVEALTETMKQYEENFGPIRIKPPVDSASPSKPA